jgi:membrane protein
MIENDSWRRFTQEAKNLLPLFRYLILQTETHAFCLAVAGAGLLGFFPSCLVMLSIYKNILKWDAAYDAMLSTVRLYMPLLDVADQDFVVRNLQVNVAGLGHGGGLSSLLWVLLGAAGVFIPLETALNRLWRVQDDRPYWMNQIVGFTLTLVCTSVGLLFVVISIPLHYVLNSVLRHLPESPTFAVPFVVLGNIARQLVVDTTTTCFFIVAIFALYKFLPNKKIDAKQVLPAAILAGVMAELVRIVYVHAIPNMYPTQGPFAISVTFLLFAYFETFVFLGCAFLATETERYPWMGFLRRKRRESPPS